MAIPTTGATVTTAVNGNGGSSAPLTGSHTTDTDTNLLVVIVTYGFQTTTPHATAVTFAGVGLTELGTIEQGNDARADIWYLKNPDIGGPFTVSVGEFGGVARLGWTAINVIGADVDGTTFGTLQTLGTVNTDLSVTLSSATDELIVGGVVGKLITNTLTIQSGTGVAELSQFAHGLWGKFATGKATGASSVNFGFDNSVTVDGVCIAIPVKGAPAGGETLETYGWRLRADDGVEATGGGTFLAAEDVAIVIGASGDVNLDTNFRVRIGLDETDAGDPIASAIQLRAKLNGGSAFTVDGASIYARMSSSGHFVDGAATTDHGLSAPAGSFVAGEIVETNGLTGSIDLAQNSYTIVEACVQARSADLVSGDTLEFGLRYDGTDYFPGAIALTIQPPPPTSVALGTVGDTTLGLTWVDPSPPDIVIRPYYKKAVDSEWIPEGALPLGTEAHTFGDLTALAVGTSYDIGVASFEGSLESTIVFITQATTGSDREAHVTAFELEVATAPRRAHVTAFEMEIEAPGRQAVVTAFEIQTYDAAQGDPVASLGNLGLGLSPIGLGI